ncbi:hypothetical protein [Oryzihumus leptocrescens]|uniref:Uncharacterized protein n=1 Tax=Oryzihumus leptocrescens TaxID=297536 RepID=A0A542ZIH9_9MICO|nr:hypothetical protein [Oryzihumus leptocrescens]TQL60153.1 hypothetical protein FB474_1536 [Oryzihumus leptocrescens]
MGWWDRLRGRRGGSGSRADGPDVSIDTGTVRAYLAEFARSRRGVEAYVEPATNMTATTVVLVAHDGEWTRRAVPSQQAAFEFARALGIPVYDVHLTGYPRRMREWTSRQRRR